MTRHHQGVYCFNGTSAGRQGNRVPVQSAYVLQNGVPPPQQVHSSMSYPTNSSHSTELIEQPITIQEETQNDSGQPIMTEHTHDTVRQPISDHGANDEMQESITETVATN